MLEQIASAADRWGLHSKIIHSDNQNAIQRTFSPEFHNRLDAIVNFAPLPPEVIGDVVDKFITELYDQLLDKNIILSVDDEVRLHLAKRL